MVFATCRGGWPESIIQTDKEAQLFVGENYVDNICKSDISTVDRVKRDPNRAKKILRSYALSDTELRSPAEGTILTRVSEPGTVVGAGQVVYALALEQHGLFLQTYLRT